MPGSFRLPALCRLVCVASILLLAFGPGGVVHAQPEVYVDASASGVNDGSSWADAYTSLQDGLADATSGDVLWVGYFRDTWEMSA